MKTLTRTREDLVVIGTLVLLAAVFANGCLQVGPKTLPTPAPVCPPNVQYARPVPTDLPAKPNLPGWTTSQPCNQDLCLDTTNAKNLLRQLNLMAADDNAVRKDYADFQAATRAWNATHGGK